MSRSRQAGVTLVETMVATLVLALGMASVVTLMIINVSSTGYANVYSQAIIHADQMADVMRANLAAYESALFTSDPGASTVDCLLGTDCSPTEQAQYDSTQWKAAVAQDLPAGQGFVCTDASPDDGQPGALACDGGGNNVIKLFWRDPQHTEEGLTGTGFRRLVITVVP